MMCGEPLKHTNHHACGWWERIKNEGVLVEQVTSGDATKGVQRSFKHLMGPFKCNLVPFSTNLRHYKRFSFRSVCVCFGAKHRDRKRKEKRGCSWGV